MIKLLFLFLASCCCIKGFAQKEITTEQYIKDFEQFVQIIKNFNPQIQIRKKVTGYDVLNEIEKNRKIIDTCSTLNSFMEGIFKCIQSNIDLHSYFPDSTFIKQISTKSIKKRNFNIKKMVETRGKFGKILDPVCPIKLPVKYLDGEYYLIKEIIFDNEILEAGSKIIACNGLPIHQYIKQNLVNFYSAPQWDFTNNRYFNETFFMLSTKEDSRLELEIEKDNKKKIINSQKGITFAKSGEFYHKRFVKLIDNILYLKIPEMQDASFYLGELLKYKGIDIKGLIIDVRGNMGGEDNVWKAILSNVVAEPIRYMYSPYFLNNKLLKKDLGMNGPIISHPDIENQTFIDFSEKVVIPNTVNSIAYKGKMVIIQDRNIFSGTGNFIRAISQSKNVIVIGQSSGYLLGFETMPQIFSLKYSKISFTLPICIDIFECPELNDIYHSKVNIEIETSIDYYQNLFSLKSENEIIAKDSFVAKAIELLKQ